MHTRMLLTLILAWGLHAPALHAQTGSVTGRVIDARTGDPLVGATVQVPAINRGVLTNVDGRYLVTSVPAGTYTLRVTYIGYEVGEQTVTVAAAPVTVDFTLEFDPVQLDAIVVTGQQIERQAREIAYAVSTIEGEELTRVRETNFVNALAGKSPGVEVLSTSGDLGASTRILIRGVSSLSGNNQPLFVVDGVPISNSNIVIGDANERIVGHIDVGNRAADLNSDDIETVTVLRGAAAAALYGQQAKNGVILITTKQGQSIGGQTVTASTSIRTSSPLVLPSFQNVYAQGTAGAYDRTDLDGWGPRIAGQEVQNFEGETVRLQAFPDNVKDFYDDGLLTINSFSVSGASETADFRLGVTYTDQGGIVPESDQTRTSININSGYDLLDNLSARLSGFYVQTDGNGRAVAGSNDPNVLTQIVNFMPRTTNTAILRDYKDESGQQAHQLDQMTNNPFWIVNENQFQQNVERFFGSSEVQYSPVAWLDLTGRAGLDTYTEDRRNVNAVGTVGRDRGLFVDDVVQERTINLDFLAESGRDINEDVNVRGIVGANLNHRELKIQRNRAENLTVAGLYNFSNARSNTPINEFEERKLYGVFFDATVGFREYLFLNATGRNDWSSTLPKENRSFFYPSVNVSFIPTEAFDLAGDVLSYAKLRANWAQVGSDEAPYQLDFRYFPVEFLFGQFGADLVFPYGGRTAFESTSTIPPTNLKPQRQTSMEIGGEFQFFNGRAGIDLTYYDVRTEDQIISLPIPRSTGFAFNRTNIGEVSNEGIEAQLNLNPVRTRNFGWDTNINFTKNENTVVSLAPGVEELQIQSAFSSLDVKAVPGEPFTLHGPKFLRDSVSGLPIIDPNTGLRRIGDVGPLGSIDPDFRLSFNNTFTVDQFTLSALVDWREGGTIFSETVGELRRRGLAEETAVNRGGTFIDEGVIPDGEGGFKPNDVPVENMEDFWNAYASGNVHEANTFDASNARLREVRLDYNVPRRWLERTPFGSLTIGLEGRNLWLFYKKVPHIDPEVGLFGSAANGQGVEWNVLPSVRSFGLNVQARF